jgi:sulfite reductase (NADPH) hemoprotein beta-component
MYRYDEFDRGFVLERVAEFRDQVERRLSGEIDRRPVQAAAADERRLPAAPRLHAAHRIPYGTLFRRSRCACSPISRAPTTRATAISPRARTSSSTGRAVATSPILADLAEVEMHALQTSGNCIRNVTADHFAGAAADEVGDPRPYAEILRQWSSVHPEFSYLPRKFKIAVTGAERDRAAIQVHDIGLHGEEERQRRTRLRRLCRRRPGPHAADRARRCATSCPRKTCSPIRPRSCASTISQGRRDNKYKARIKILVHETGTEEFSRQVEAEFALKDGVLTLARSRHRGYRRLFRAACSRSRALRATRR